jgi:hypothetical protein
MVAMPSEESYGGQVAGTFLPAVTEVEMRLGDERDELPVLLSET